MSNMKFINKLCVHSAVFLNVKSGGTYSYQCAVGLTTGHMHMSLKGFCSNVVPVFFFPWNVALHAWVIGAQSWRWCSRLQRM